MQAVANNPKFAKKVGVPQSVGREFTKKEGDDMKKDSMKKMKSGGIAASKMGMVKTAKPKMGSASTRADGVAMKGKTRGMQPKMMRKGGRAC